MNRTSVEYLLGVSRAILARLELEEEDWRAAGKQPNFPCAAYIYEFRLAIEQTEREQTILETDEAMLDACAAHLKGRRVERCADLEDVTG